MSAGRRDLEGALGHRLTGDISEIRRIALQPLPGHVALSSRKDRAHTGQPCHDVTEVFRRPHVQARHESRLGCVGLRNDNPASAETSAASTAGSTPRTGRNSTIENELGNPYDAGDRVDGHLLGGRQDRDPHRQGRRNGYDTPSNERARTMTTTADTAVRLISTSDRGDHPFPEHCPAWCDRRQHLDFAVENGA